MADFQLHVGRRRLIEVTPIAHDGSVAQIEPDSLAYAVLDATGAPTGAAATAPGPRPNTFYVRGLAPATNLQAAVKGDADLGPAIQEVANLKTFDVLPELAERLDLAVGDEEPDPDGPEAVPAGAIPLNVNGGAEALAPAA